MFNLPQELVNLVFEFDCTKRENFDKVLEEFKQIRDYNWENYCWFGIGNHPDDVKEEFRWTKRIHDGDCWEYVYKYNFNYIEYKLNRKLEDFLYHEFNEE